MSGKGMQRCLRKLYNYRIINTYEKKNIANYLIPIIHYEYRLFCALFFAITLKLLTQSEKLIIIEITSQNKEIG